MYFVIVTGDLEKDPMDKTIADFPTRDAAAAFMEVHCNKGYECRLFWGEFLFKK